MENESKIKYNIIQPLLLASIMAVGIMIGLKIGGHQRGMPLVSSSELAEGVYPTGRIEELLRFIESKYVDSIDTDTLLDDAIYALIENLDPHSDYLTPSEVEEINHQMEGFYHGIGIELVKVGDTAIIYKVLDNSPAKTAGLKPGDQILSVNGLKVAGVSKSYEEIRKELKMPIHETLTIRIREKDKEVDKKIVVAEVPVSSVSCGYEVNDSILYVKIDRFGSNTYQEFMEKIEGLFGQSKFKHLVLDLRGNPGGYLPEATNILCQIFEEKNRVLVTTVAKNQKKSAYESTGKRFFNIQKVAVLVDENSASASEIIAGALQDWDRGVVVGRRTYGKGLVQEQYDLTNGGAIRLTVAKYYTPSGRSIQRSYKDKTSYEEDLVTRAENGAYFREEDVSNKKRSTIFKSLVKGRKLYAGGGIDPDFFVPLDSVFLWNEFADMEPFFAPYYIKNKESATFRTYKSYKEIAAYSMSMNELKKFLEFAGVKLNESQMKTVLPVASRFMRIVMTNVHHGEDKAIQMDNEHDDVFQRSLSFLIKGK